MKRLQTMIAVIFLAILGVIMVVGIWNGDSYAYWTCFWSMVLLSVPLMLDRLEKVTLPWPVVLCAGVALALHSFGLVTGLYGFYWWDKLTHLMSGIVVASLVCLVLLVVLYHSVTIRIPAVWFPFLLIVSVLAFEGVWEILEFSMDMLVGTAMQYGVQDTVNDIVTNAVSGILAGAVAAYYIGKSSVEKIVEGMRVEKSVQYFRKHVDR